MQRAHSWFAVVVLLCLFIGYRGGFLRPSNNESAQDGVDSAVDGVDGASSKDGVGVETPPSNDSGDAVGTESGLGKKGTYQPPTQTIKPPYDTISGLFSWEGTIEWDAKMNIFAAGLPEMFPVELTSCVADDDGGILPARRPLGPSLPSGSVLRFTSISGRYHYCNCSWTIGPEGFRQMSQYIRSLNALSDFIAPSAFALGGVFLGPGGVKGPQPPPLNFSSIGTDFLYLAPLLGQVFFVGDGRTLGGQVQSFAIPEGAAHFYLGVVDGTADAASAPGCYADNSGSGVAAYSIERSGGHGPSEDASRSVMDSDLVVNGDADAVGPSTDSNDRPHESSSGSDGLGGRLLQQLSSPIPTPSATVSSAWAGVWPSPWAMNNLQEANVTVSANMNIYQAANAFVDPLQISCRNNPGSGGNPPLKAVNGLNAKYIARFPSIPLSYTVCANCSVPQYVSAEGLVDSTMYVSSTNQMSDYIGPAYAFVGVFTSGECGVQLHRITGVISIVYYLYSLSLTHHITPFVLYVPHSAGGSISNSKVPSLNFTAIGTDFASIEPLQDQVFYIGDGRNSNGEMQAFLVPQAGNSLWYVDLPLLFVVMTQ